MMAKLEKYKTVLNLYRNGEKLVDIAKKVGLGLSNVNYIIYSREKITRKIEIDQKLTPEEIARIIHLYRWGYTPNEISEEIPIKPSEIATIIEINDAKRLPNINNLKFMERGHEPSGNSKPNRFK
jgi:hypothetical protein